MHAQKRGQYPGLANNGNNPGVMDPRYLDGLFTQGQSPNTIKEFVHPGKDPGELLMRCIFKDDREATAAVLFLSKCEEFGLERHKRLLLHKLASTTSVKGIGRKELLQAVTGTLSSVLYGAKDNNKERGKDRE